MAGHGGGSYLGALAEALAAHAELGLVHLAHPGEPEPDGRTLRLALAGHEPPLVWRAASGEVEELEAGGLALGMLPELEGRLREDRVEFERGDVLLCYTDGVTECRAPDGSLFGRARLAAALAAAAPRGAAEVRAAVERELDAYRAGGERSDDVTMLVLEAGREGPRT